MRPPPPKGKTQEEDATEATGKPTQRTEWNLVDFDFARQLVAS